MNKFDIMMGIIIVIIISILIGVNINNVIDSKLSNISVNIPPIKFPEPSITVKIQKDCKKDEYDVYVEKGTTSEFLVEKPNEHFVVTHPLQLPQEEKYVKSYTIQNQSKLPIIDVSTIAGNGNITPITEHSVQFPDADNIIKYSNYTCFKHSQSETQPETQPETQSPQMNKSLFLDKYETYKYLIKNQTFIPDDSDLMEHADPAEVFKKHQKFVKSYIDDPIMRGSNINDFNDSAGIYNIGNYDLNKSSSEPQPTGYIFNDSPILQ